MGCTTLESELEKWSANDHADTKFGHSSFLTVPESKVIPHLAVNFRPKLRNLFKIEIEKYLVITITQKNVFQLVFHFKKLMLCGDIESNPGPTTYQQHRACCNRFYSTSVKIGKKTCLQQFLDMNSGQFYYWQKKELIMPENVFAAKTF